MKHKFITIEGNIGAGKTTLSKMLSKRINAKAILESFENNPFLPKFYKEPEKHAFAVELFFMAERYKQMQEIMGAGDLFHTLYLSDYLFYKSLIFGSVTLNPDEKKLFSNLFQIINRNLPRPGLIIYLHNKTETLLSNIRKRGREYEQGISADYLDRLDENYLQYLKSIDKAVIFIVNMEGRDFVENEPDFNVLLELLYSEADPGIHYV